MEAIQKLENLVGTNPKWFTEPASVAYGTNPHVPDAPAVYEKLKAFATSLGYVPREKLTNKVGLNGETNYAARTITIRKDMSPYHKAVVLVHELGHILHGELFAQVYSTPITETYAESVAFLVADSLGWPTDLMAGYLSHNSGARHIDELREAIRGLAPFTTATAAEIMAEVGLSKAA